MRLVKRLGDIPHRPSGWPLHIALAAVAAAAVAAPASIRAATGPFILSDLTVEPPAAYVLDGDASLGGGAKVYRCDCPAGKKCTKGDLATGELRAILDDVVGGKHFMGLESALHGLGFTPIDEVGGRWATSSQRSLDVYVLAGQGYARPEVKVTDRKPRSSEFSSDLRTLLKLMQTIAGQASGAGTEASTEGENLCIADKLTGSKLALVAPADRELWTVTTSAKPVGQGGDAALESVRAAIQQRIEDLKGTPSLFLDEAVRVEYAQLLDFLASNPLQEKPGLRSVSFRLRVGKDERLFLSADVPVTRAETLVLDDEGNLSNEGEPGRVYLGFNYQFGDRDVRYTGRSAWRNVYLKLMVEASSDPGDSVGWAVGYRNLAFAKGNFVLQAISPWVGYTYTTEDGPDGRRSGRNGEFRAGLSLNLSEALDLVRSNADSESE